MNLAHAIREALENQVLEHEPGQAALVLRGAVEDAGTEAVASMLLDTAAVALRRMVADTDEAFEQDDLLERLAFDGAVPADSIDILRRMLALAAATAGGVRPPVTPVIEEVGQDRAMFGSWLTTLTVIRVVAISMERTEADVTEEVVSALDTL